MASRTDGDSSLKRFAECAETLRNILYQDGAFSEAECIFMNNHFQVLEMAYLRWKEKQRMNVSVGRTEIQQVKAA